MPPPKRATPRPKPRLARVGREETRHHIEEAGETWAVSYADFLMVLLSFFILFFSTDADQKESIVQQIVAELDGGQSGGAGEGSGGGGGAQVRGAASTGGAGPVTLGTSTLRDLKTQLTGLEHLDVETSKTGVLIHLADNIFDRGRLEPRSDQLPVLRSLLSRMESFRTRIKVTVVGRIDDAPVQRARRLGVRNNFDVSSLRATHFLQMMVKHGFSPEQLAAKGTAEFGRNSRTLSLLLEAKETETP